MKPNRFKLGDEKMTPSNEVTNALKDKKIGNLTGGAEKKIIKENSADSNNGHEEISEVNDRPRSSSHPHPENFTIRRNPLDGKNALKMRKKLLDTKLKEKFLVQPVGLGEKQYYRMCSEKLLRSPIFPGTDLPPMVVLNKKANSNKVLIALPLPPKIVLPRAVQEAAKNCERIMFLVQTAEERDILHCELVLFSGDELKKIQDTSNGKMVKECTIEIFIKDEGFNVTDAKMTVLGTQKKGEANADEKVSQELKNLKDKTVPFTCFVPCGSTHIQSKPHLAVIEGLKLNSAPHFFSVVTPKDKAPIVTYHCILPESDVATLSVQLRSLQQNASYVTLFERWEADKKAHIEKSGNSTLPSYLEGTFTTLKDMFLLNPPKESVSRNLRILARNESLKSATSNDGDKTFCLDNIRRQQLFLEWRNLETTAATAGTASGETTVASVASGLVTRQHSSSAPPILNARVTFQAKQATSTVALEIAKYNSAAVVTTTSAGGLSTSNSKNAKKS